MLSRQVSITNVRAVWRYPTPKLQPICQARPIDEQGNRTRGLKDWTFKSDIAEGSKGSMLKGLDAQISLEL